MINDLEELDRRVIELTKGGKTAIEIAEVLDVSRAQVNRSRIRTGIRVRRPMRRIDYAAMEPRYADLHSRGYTDSGIAERLGVSRNTSQRIGRKLGLPPNQRFKHDRSIVERMYHEGVSDRRIAEELGTTPGEVSKIRGQLRLVTERKPAIPAELEPDIRAMLEDGASYAETSRTLGVPESALRRKFPGMGWTVKQRTEFVAMRRLEKEVGIT